MSFIYSDKINKNGQKMLKPWAKVILLIPFFVGFFFLVIMPIIDLYRSGHPVDQQCTVLSAELSKSSSGTGGISTSGTKLKINTADCGTVYVDHSITPKKSYQDMADELNQHQGQKVTLIFPPFQWPAVGDYALGYGYRL